MPSVILTACDPAAKVSARCAAGGEPVHPWAGGTRGANQTCSPVAQVAAVITDGGS